LTNWLLVLIPGLLEPSPLMETEIKSACLMVMILLSSMARPSESKPGPKFALVAGTFIVNYFPLFIRLAKHKEVRHHLKNVFALALLAG